MKIEESRNEHWHCEPKWNRNHTAETLWNDACGYFEWCVANPIGRPEMIRGGKDAGETLYLDMPRPFNLAALCIHVGISKEYLYDLMKSKVKDDYYFVAERIFAVMYAQKFEGAMVGIFNPIIAAKEIGLASGETERGTPIINIGIVNNGAPALLNSEIAKIEKSK